MTKEQWSVPTWYFFHGFAHKINETFYNKNYKECWNKIIVNICNSLPCPICNYHANLYISKVHDYQINTKEKLKNFLWQFHNNVNNRLNKTLYKLEDLDKYRYLRLNKAYIATHNNIVREYYGSKTLNSWRRKKQMNVTYKYLLSIWKYIEN